MVSGGRLAWLRALNNQFARLAQGSSIHLKIDHTSRDRARPVRNRVAYGMSIGLVPGFSSPSSVLALELIVEVILNAFEEEKLVSRRENRRGIRSSRKALYIQPTTITEALTPSRLQPDVQILTNLEDVQLSPNLMSVIASCLIFAAGSIPLPRLQIGS